VWFANRLSNVKPFNDIWGRVVFRKDLAVGESQKQETMLCVTGLRRRACALTFSALPLPQTDPFDALLGRRDFSESLFLLVRPVRFELTTFCSGGKRSIQTELRAHNQINHLLNRSLGSS
jgi:hypothetical protein